MITVFTPTYNRGYIIGNLFESLKRQTSADFEWIVINDGSTDNTSALFEKWRKEVISFPIIYVETPNGGKQRAINKGVNMASGDAFFIVDSDDYLVEDAIENYCKWFKDIESNETFAGVSGLRGYSNGNPIGGYGSFDGEYIDCTNIERHKFNLLDDKAEVYKTSILKMYPFPEFEGENFVPEPVVWDHIGKDGYKIRWYNTITYICEYLPDGLTANDDRFVENPKGFIAYLEMLEQIHDVKEVDYFRLQFYKDLVNKKGEEYAFEIIRYAQELKRGKNSYAR